MSSLWSYTTLWSPKLIWLLPKPKPFCNLVSPWQRWPPRALPTLNPNPQFLILKSTDSSMWLWSSAPPIRFLQQNLYSPCHTSSFTNFCCCLIFSSDVSFFTCLWLSIQQNSGFLETPSSTWFVIPLTIIKTRERGEERKRPVSKLKWEKLPSEGKHSCQLLLSKELGLLPQNYHKEFFLASFRIQVQC